MCDRFEAGWCSLLESIPGLDFVDASGHFCSSNHGWLIYELAAKEDVARVAVMGCRHYHRPISLGLSLSVPGLSL